MIKVPVSGFVVVVVVVFGLELFIVWLVKKITKGRKVVPYLLFFPYNPQLTAAFFRSLIIRVVIKSQGPGIFPGY